MGRVEVDVVRALNVGIDELVCVGLPVNVQYCHRHLLLFVQASAVGLNDEVRALDVRGVLYDDVSRVAVKAAGPLPQVPGEGVQRVWVCFVDLLHSSLEQNFG